jgi:hypothetical protein
LGIAAIDFRNRVANSAKEKQRLSTLTPGGHNTNSQHFTVEDVDVRILLRLALTDENTRCWMEETRRESLAHIQVMPCADLLTEIWQNPPESTKLHIVNAYLTKFSPEKENALRDVLVERFANLQLEDAQRALLRLRIKALEETRDTTKTKVAQPNLGKSQILDLTSKVESQRKELLELKIALKHIRSSRA